MVKNNKINSVNIYKNILLGTNTFFSDWYEVIKKISMSNIFITDFEKSDLNKIIIDNNIELIIPLSLKDYNIIKKNNTDTYTNIRILHPDEKTFNLLNNKLEFTKWMYDNFPNMIPTVYYLNQIEISKIKFPVISKPIYSTNGIGMKIYYDANNFEFCNDKKIVQKFIKYSHEYSGFFLCEEGKILNWKILKHKFFKYNIKQNNFPQNCTYVENFQIGIFEPIIKKLNYSGGMCIDFKYNEKKNKIYIFEINPRFGGSAFSNNFICELLCVKKNLYAI